MDKEYIITPKGKFFSLVEKNKRRIKYGRKISYLCEGIGCKICPILNICIGSGYHYKGFAMNKKLDINKTIEEELFKYKAEVLTEKLND